MKRINFTRLAFFILLAVLRQPVSAQVKIGANPSVIDPNSLLEMEQNTGTGRYGMRLPRVALDSTSSFAPLTAHVQGMTVYNTATAGTGLTSVIPGIYTNDGTQWVRLTTGGSNVTYPYSYVMSVSAGVPNCSGIAGSSSLITSTNGGVDFNGMWVCPASGYYQFSISASTNATGTDNSWTLARIYNTTSGGYTNITTSINTPYSTIGSQLAGFVFINCVAGQGYRMDFYYASCASAVSVGGTWTVSKFGEGGGGSVGPDNQPPTAQNVTVSGNALLGQAITSGYTYNDFDGNPESGTIRQWYRADDASGTNETPIAGATGITYAVNYADMGKYIRVGITPGASVGATPGTIAYSAYKSVYDCGAPTATVTFTYNGASVTYGTLQSPTTGRCFLDRNLGATAVATAYNDANGYGHYFQWGRPDDGHQVPTSSTSTVLSTTDFPGSAFFITPPNASPYDWRDNNNSNRWEVNPQGPCPTGWHVPRESEWVAETGTSNYSTAYAQLKLTSAGTRAWDGNVYYSGSIYGQYWSSSKSTADSRGSSFHYWDSNGPYNSWDWRATGHSVRCIKD